MNIFEYPFIFRELNKYLTDKDKLKLISLNKFLNSKRKLFLFKILIKYKDNLENEWYYNSITKLIIIKIVKLPERLKYLEVDFEISTKEDALLFSNMMPRTLQKIYLHQHYENCHFVSPPFSITMCLNNLNENIILNNIKSLKILNLTSEFNDFRKLKCLAIYYAGDFLTQKLPNSIECLVLGNVNSLTPGIIPNSVKKLNISFLRDFELKSIIPNSVSNLKLICATINQNLEGCIPNSVTRLHIGPISNFIVPKNVTHLTSFDANLLKTLTMTSVINLRLTPYSYRNILIIDIPICVVHLTIFDNNQTFKLNLNNVKFLKTTKRYYELIKDCISEDIQISYFD